MAQSFLSHLAERVTAPVSRLLVSARHEHVVLERIEKYGPKVEVTK